MINFFKGIYSNRKFLSVSNSKTTAVRMKKSKTIKSTIRSEIIVPNPLSKGTPSYFVSKAALEISPDLGIVKFKK